MKHTPHANISKGVATGSWLLKAQLESKVHRNLDRPSFMSPINAVQTRPVAQTPSTVSVVRCSKKLVLALLAIVLGAGIGTFVLMEAGGVINWIPPAWNPPPLSPYPPPPPSIPPHPPSPPSPPIPPPSPSPPPHPPFTIALSTCRHVVGNQIVILVNNHRCEDGGSTSKASICELGTDYPDCPARESTV